MLLILKTDQRRNKLSTDKYGKANNKYMEDYEKDKESSDLQYWDVNYLYGWAMLQRLPVINFKWVKDISKFDESFIKSYFIKGYFLKVNDQYPEKLHYLHNDLPFLHEEI